MIIASFSPFINVCSPLPCRDHRSLSEVELVSFLIEGATRYQLSSHEEVNRSSAQVHLISHPHPPLTSPSPIPPHPQLSPTPSPHHPLLNLTPSTGIKGI